MGSRLKPILYAQNVPTIIQLQIFHECAENNVYAYGYIVVVKKTFRYTNVFLLQPLMPPFLISE